MDYIDYISSDKQNVSKYELRDLIDEITHQLCYLDKSQLELLSALQEDPNDIDFKQAYHENKQVILRKKEAIIKLKEKLMELDIAYYLEHYRNQQYIFNHTDASDSEQDTTTAVDNNIILNSEIIVPVQDNTNNIPEGMYL